MKTKGIQIQVLKKSKIPTKVTMTGVNVGLTLTESVIIQSVKAIRVIISKDALPTQ